MEISVPRDREGEYEPVAVPKGTSDVSELERKVLKGKGAFPNKQAAMKILYLRTMDIMKNWANPISNWGDHTRQTGSAVGRRLGRLTAPGSNFSSLHCASFVKIGT